MVSSFRGAVGYGDAKLLQLPWFERLYGRVIALREKARAIVEPIKLRIREAMGGEGDGWLSRLLRSIRQFRKRVQAAR